MHIVACIQELNHLIPVPTAGSRRGNQVKEVFKPDSSDTPTLSFPMAGMIVNYLKELSKNSRPNGLLHSFTPLEQRGGGIIKWSRTQLLRFGNSAAANCLIEGLWVDCLVVVMQHLFASCQPK